MGGGCEVRSGNGAKGRKWDKEDDGRKEDKKEEREGGMSGGEEKE